MGWSILSNPMRLMVEVAMVRLAQANVSSAAEGESAPLGRLSLLRPVYVSLLNTGRSYAAFDEQLLHQLVKDLSSRSEILDPMSGYGCLTAFCSRAGIASHCLEYLAPLYLWQRLVHPPTSRLLADAVGELLNMEDEWPQASTRALASDRWLPPESERLILRLLALCRQAVAMPSLPQEDSDHLSLALLLPFSGRLMAWVPGEATRIKQGGICVYQNWEGDFRHYLLALHSRLERIMSESKLSVHTVELGDCRSYSFELNRFAAMITSPPYPNHQSFTRMFSPERHLLRWLEAKGVSTVRVSKTPAIGALGVKGRRLAKVRSRSALRFLRDLLEWKGSRRAMYDNRIYYCPYFEAYFADLERAFENISVSLGRDFMGYMIVVDNTCRDQFVPLSKFVVETWRRLGFDTKAEKLREKFHVGTKNPRARGFKAKHTEYLITIARK